MRIVISATAAPANDKDFDLAFLGQRGRESTRDSEGMDLVPINGGNHSPASVKRAATHRFPFSTRIDFGLIVGGIITELTSNRGSGALTSSADRDFDGRSYIERGKPIDIEAGIKGRVASDSQAASDDFVASHIKVARDFDILPGCSGKDKVRASHARDGRGYDRYATAEDFTDGSLAERRGRGIVDDDGIAGSDAARDGRLVGDGAREQDSPVRLIVQARGRDLLPVGVGFRGLDLSHLFASLGHDARDDGLHRDRPDGRAEVKGLEMHLRVVP